MFGLDSSFQSASIGATSLSSKAHACNKSSYPYSSKGVSCTVRFVPNSHSLSLSPWFFVVLIFF